MKLHIRQELKQKNMTPAIHLRLTYHRRKTQFLIMNTWSRHRSKCYPLISLFWMKLVKFEEIVTMPPSNMHKEESWLPKKFIPCNSWCCKMICNGLNTETVYSKYFQTEMIKTNSTKHTYASFPNRRLSFLFDCVVWKLFWRKTTISFVQCFCKGMWHILGLLRLKHLLFHFWQILWASCKQWKSYIKLGLCK